jgi:hypothetical protein
MSLSAYFAVALFFHFSVEAFIRLLFSYFMNTILVS